MSQWQVELDRAGIGAILKSSETHQMVNDAAQRVAANVPGDVVVEAYTTDRGAAAVIHRERDAVGQQAKNGTLTTAAAMAGLRVSGRR